MNELSPQGGSEGYGACSDEAACLPDACTPSIPLDLFCPIWSYREP